MFRYILIYFHRWEIDWGDDYIESGDAKVIGPFGPVVHTYDAYTCQAGDVCITVRYCHNSMNYYDECCDSFKKCVYLTGY